MAPFLETVESFYLQGSGTKDELRDPLVVFDLFLFQEWEQTDFAQGGAKATCLLDYMFVWLVESNGAMYCPTYEHWLLAIVRFADIVLPPAAPLPESDPGDEGYSGRDYVRSLRDGATKDLDLMLTGSASHPALDRSMYERCREGLNRRIAQQDRKSLRRQLQIDLSREIKK